MKHILILGCGWLAEEFANAIQQKGYQVWATTTSEQKYHRFKNDGIFAYIHNFDEEKQLDIPTDLFFDLILTSVPANQKLDLPEVENRFTNIANNLNRYRYKKHFFLSSVGVYPDIDGVFTENFDDESLLSTKLRLAENIIQTLPDSIVFRLGGLFGKNRIFAKYFQEKVCTTGSQPANFVHIDDVVALLIAGLNNSLADGIYNVVTPDHPLKKDVILQSAEKYNFLKPLAFKPEHSFQKIVSGEKLTECLNYTFKYPSPLDF